MLDNAEKKKFEPKDDQHYNTVQKCCTNFDFFYEQVAKKELHLKTELDNVEETKQNEQQTPELISTEELLKKPSASVQPEVDVLLESEKNL